MTQKEENVSIFWDPPTNADGSVYEHLKEYELHHNIPGYPNPLVVPPSVTSGGPLPLPKGKYSVAIRAVNNEGHKSKKVITKFQVKNPPLNPAAKRFGKVCIGGVISSTTTITDGILNIENTTGWSFAGGGAPQVVSTFTSTTATVNGAVNNSASVTLTEANSVIEVGMAITGSGISAPYPTVSAIDGTSLTLSNTRTIADTTVLTFGEDRIKQDCSDVATQDFSTFGNDEKAIKSHYILFDYSDSNDPWKLIKYEDTVFSSSNNLNIAYFYDAGDGDVVAEDTFVTQTGTVTVAAGSNEVVGNGTDFQTEYEIDDIIYFNSSQAAIVTYIDSDVSLTIDRSFTAAISSAIKKQGLTIDPDYDSLIYTIRNNNNTFEKYGIELNVDSDVFTGQGIRQVSIYKLNDSSLTTNDFGNFTNPLTGAEAGWSLAFPGVSDDEDKVYQSSRTFTSDGLSPQDATWTAPVIYAERNDGSAGTGQGTKYVNLYKLNDDSLTSNTFGTWTDPTSGAEAGWTIAVPDIGTTDGNEIYVTSRTFTSDGESPQTATWTDPVVYSKYTEGNQGIQGIQGEDGVKGDAGDSIDIVFVRSASQPSTPSPSTSPPSGWYTSVTNVPSSSNPMWSSVGTKTSGASVYTWQEPIQIEGSEGGSGLSVAELTIYRRAAATPSPNPPTGGSFNFSTGVVTPPTNWFSYIPAGANALYTSRGLASIVGVTGTDSDITWTSALLSMQDGATGALGPRTATGYVYYNQSGAVAAEPGTEATYNYATGLVGGMTANWENDPPTHDEPNSDYHYASYTVTEDSYNGNETVVFADSRVGLGFNTLVTFTSSEPSGGWFTTVDGGYIATNIIESHNYSASGDQGFSSTGLRIDLRDGYKGIRSPQFYINGENGNAEFSGSLAAGTLLTNVTSGNRKFHLGQGTVIDGKPASIAGQGLGGSPNPVVGIVGTAINNAGVAGGGDGTGYGVYAGYATTAWSSMTNEVNMGTSTHAINCTTGTGKIETIGNITAATGTFSGAVSSAGLTGSTADFDGLVEVDSLKIGGHTLGLSGKSLTFPSSGDVGQFLKLSSINGTTYTLDWDAAGGGGGPGDIEGVTAGNGLDGGGTTGTVSLSVNDEYISDLVGAMVGGNTETGITVTYQDGDNTLDFVVGTLNQDTTGNAATATALATARTIGGVSFNGTANIDLPGVNTAGTVNTSGNAATATSAAAWTTPRQLSLAGDLGGSVTIDGSENETLTATIQANSVALTTDTTGNYTQSIADSGSGNISVVNGVAEGGVVTLNTIQDIKTTSTPQFAALGIGAANSGAGTITSTGNITSAANVTAFSDIRLKSDVHTIENGLDKVSKMRGVTYTKDFIPGSGVIAQELEKIAPELVEDGKYKSVAYGNIVGYLIEAIKELKEKVEELENGKTS